MTIQLIYLEKFDWLIKIFYNTNADDAEVILKELDEIECESNSFYKIAEMLESDNLNYGFTYSDTNLHVSMVGIGMTSSAKEFMNTMSHEITHVATHIVEYYQLFGAEEEIASLVGDICLEMYDIAKDFLCEHCRDITFYNFGKVKIKMKKED